MPVCRDVFRSQGNTENFKGPVGGYHLGLAQKKPVGDGYLTEISLFFILAPVQGTGKSTREILLPLQTGRLNEGENLKVQEIIKNKTTPVIPLTSDWGTLDQQITDQPDTLEPIDRPGSLRHEINHGATAMETGTPANEASFQNVEVWPPQIQIVDQDVEQADARNIGDSSKIWNFLRMEGFGLWGITPRHPTIIDSKAISTREVTLLNGYLMF